MDEKTEYIRKGLDYDLPILAHFEKQYRERDDLQPFIEPEVGKFLAFLIQACSLRQVLELGTGIGYSTLWIASALEKTGGSVTTIDNHGRTNREARGYFDQSGLGHLIRPIQDSIERAVPALSKTQPESFDLIFQDGGKHLYPVVYEYLYTLLVPGGILVTDDVLFPVEQSVRQGLKAPVEQFNDILRKDKRFYTAILPAGHGVSVSWKRNDQLL